MDGKESIHDYDARLNVVLRKLDRSAISEENKRLIREYLDFCALENLGKGRVVKYAYYMIMAFEIAEECKRTGKTPLEYILERVGYKPRGELQ